MNEIDELLQRVQYLTGNLRHTQEKLARVEAERDVYLADWVREQHGNTLLQAQLAEAMGLLRAIDRDIWPEWESRFGKSAALINVQAFLADYAQAEQQEAQGAQAGEGGAV